MKKNIIKNIVGAVALASLAACSGSGSCPPGQTPNGQLSLAITAPNQYPAGVAVTAYLTMTNTSTVDATNLYYAVPGATNYTGSNNITIQNGAGNNPCVNIAAGKSCTFPAEISASSHPGSFTVTATPNGSSQSSVSKLVSAVGSKLGLQAGSLELTANIGLSNVPTNNENGANGITFLYAKTVKQSVTGGTLISLVGVVSSASAGAFNNINLTDASGNLLKFENLSGASSQALTQNSVVTFLLEIPAGVTSYSFYGQTTNNGSLVNQGTVKNTINLVEDNVGILNGQPASFNLQSGYESQIVTYTNTGLGTASNISFTLPEPLTLISNGCSGKTLASGDSCNYTVGFDSTSLVSGTTTLVATYTNGQSSNNEVDSTITYTARVPVVGLTISGNSNPNFNFSSSTTQTMESSVVTLTNSGSRPLYNVSWNLPSHFSTSVNGVSNPCGSTLAAGSSCNVSLIYTNSAVTAPTEATATVNYKYKGINQQEYSGASQTTLSYQTTQATAALSITPASLAFGNVLNNNSASSAQQTFTIVNGGSDAASVVSSSFVESNAALFNIVSSSCNSSIPANSSCTITAKFGPFSSSTSAGTKTAALKVQYKPYASSTNILSAKSNVTGQAVSAQSAVIANSSAVAGGFESGNGTESTPYSVTTGNPAPTLTYTITNSGSVPANSFYLNTSALSGKWTVSSNNCGTSNSKVTLSANGGSCTFTVRVASTGTVQANNFVPSQIQANWVDEDSPAPAGQSQNLSGSTVYASVAAAVPTKFWTLITGGAGQPAHIRDVYGSPTPQSIVVSADNPPSDYSRYLWVYVNGSWTQLCNGENGTPGAGQVLFNTSPTPTDILWYTNGNELWSYKDGNWSKLLGAEATVNTPSGATFGGVVGNSNSSFIVGTDFDGYQLWMYNNKTWTKLTGGVNQPVNAYMLSKASAQPNSITIYDGSGNIWFYNGTTWNKVGDGTTPPNPYANTMGGTFYGDSTSTSILFTPGRNARNSLWVYNGSSWTQVSGTTLSGTPLDVSAIFGAPSNNSLISRDGNLACNPNCDNYSIWTYVSGAWTNMTTGNGETSPQYGWLVYGTNAVPSQFFMSDLQDSTKANLWEWHGNSWSKKTGSANGPTSVSFVGGNPTHDSFVMMDGTIKIPDYSNTQVWTYVNGSWTNITGHADEPAGVNGLYGMVNPNSIVATHYISKMLGSDLWIGKR